MPQTPRHERGSMNGNQNSGNGKKKYGRNNHANNKFSKAAPAPMSSDRADRNANNGLLLLSTKKTSSSMLASKNATISSGVGTTMNLHHQACTSTHQALLSAVAGTQQVGPQEKPDAWGTAESGRREKVNNTSIKAQKVRSLICHDYVQAFKDVDVIIMPTTPSPAFKIGEKIEDPIAMYLNDLLTVGASLAGVAAISVPGPTQGLPVGIQLQANYFGENLLFEVGKEIENTFKATPAKL